MCNVTSRVNYHSNLKYKINKMHINIEDFSKICRICLSEGSLMPLHGSRISEGLLITEVMSTLAFAMDLQNPKLPQQICTLCIEHVNICYDFKNRCMQNEKELKLLLENYEVESKLCMVEVKEEDGDNYSCSDDEIPLIFRVEKKCVKRKRPETESHVCKQCNKTFQFKYKLTMHMRVHTKEKPYKCDECDLRFSLNGNLRRHKMIHTGERPHICDVCGKGFIQITSLQSHTKKHLIKKSHYNYSCQICNRVFIRAAPFNLHMKKHHPADMDGDLIEGVNEPPNLDDSKTEFKCSVCDKSFRKEIFLRRHELRHGEKTFLCNDCGKGFVSKGDLQSHVKVHTGEKPHKCSICEKSFAHAGSLVTHSLMHSGYKPYNCHICQKSFTQLSHLKVHQRTHNGERPYFCSYCGKNFALKSNLTVHIRTHTGETPFVCTVCGRGFHDSSSMKKHKNSHLNVEICNGNGNGDIIKNNHC